MSTDTAKQSLYFAHANGFPAASYNKMFAALPRTFEVLALEQFGHNPRFPISDNWTNQVDELIQHIEGSEKAPVYAVGHSFGGVISYMAACQRPELFKGLIMLDPPIVTGFTRLMFKLLKPTPFIERFSPAGKAAKRCKRWDRDVDLVAYFKSRGLFKNMDDDCIQDYVNAATKRDAEHYTLSFEPDVEANIFRALPHNIPSYYGQLKTPTVLVTAESTTVCVPKMIEPFVRKNQLEHKIFANGGHMFPLEQPIEVAKLISDTLKQWEDQQLSA